MIPVRQGDAYSGVRRLTITALDADGAAASLTGVTLEFAVFANRRATEALFTKSTPTEVEIATPQTGDTKGKAYITIDESDTEDLDPRDFMVYELQSTDAEGPLTLATGRFVLLPQLIT